MDVSIRKAIQSWSKKLCLERCLSSKAELTFHRFFFHFSTCHTSKVFKYGIFSGPYFPAFGLNTKRYFVSLRIQSECKIIRTRKNSVFRHISYSVPPMHIFYFNRLMERKPSGLLVCFKKKRRTCGPMKVQQVFY